MGVDFCDIHRVGGTECQFHCSGDWCNVDFAIDGSHHGAGLWGRYKGFKLVALGFIQLGLRRFINLIPFLFLLLGSPFASA